jgi:hypothetical protein
MDNIRMVDPHFGHGFLSSGGKPNFSSNKTLQLPQRTS